MKDGNCKSSLHIFDDWFYILLILVIGLVILAVNLGFISSTILTYWPILLIIIGLKELLDRN